MGYFHLSWGGGYVNELSSNLREENWRGLAVIEALIKCIYTWGHPALRDNKTRRKSFTLEMLARITQNRHLYSLQLLYMNNSKILTLRNNVYSTFLQA